VHELVLLGHVGWARLWFGRRGRTPTWVMAAAVFLFTMSAAVVTTWSTGGRGPVGAGVATLGGGYGALVVLGVASAGTLPRMAAWPLLPVHPAWRYLGTLLACGLVPALAAAAAISGAELVGLGPDPADPGGVERMLAAGGMVLDVASGGLAMGLVSVGPGLRGLAAARRGREPAARAPRSAQRLAGVGLLAVFLVPLVLGAVGRAWMPAAGVLVAAGLVVFVPQGAEFPARVGILGAPADPTPVVAWLRYLGGALALPLALVLGTTFVLGLLFTGLGVGAVFLPWALWLVGGGFVGRILRGRGPYALADLLPLAPDAARRAVLALVVLAAAVLTPLCEEAAYGQWHATDLAVQASAAVLIVATLTWSRHVGARRRLAALAGLAVAFWASSPWHEAHLGGVFGVSEATRGIVAWANLGAALGLAAWSVRR
jgi:hypothetical protein